ncbi:MAG: thiamine pyrophosphate-binding protein [Phycisphaeraceae bacterium]|nr:thiamine pyrophosphate-binding protein [Phycisphaeraceae bacterium]
MAAENPRAALERTRRSHAAAIAGAGGVARAIETGAVPPRIDSTLSEALVLGLLLQDVRTFLVVLGHGSTEVGEVLRIYEEAGLLRTCCVRHEIAASHAATALRWVTGEKAVVVTSIGPGALQAMAGSIAPASDGFGVWYLFGDETTEDEGPNMQQIPKHEQGLYLRLCSTMGRAYTLHTPGALPTALRRGLNTVDHPHRAGPFYLLLPMNTQGSAIPNLNLAQLPTGAPPALGAAADEGGYAAAKNAIPRARRVVVKIGGGGRGATDELLELLDRADGVAVTSPLVSGVIPYDNPRNMTVGGSKGSICGNFAMEEADLLIAVGTRAVCQSDSSRTGYPKVKAVINVNADVDAAMHYGRTIALVGDAAATLKKLNAALGPAQAAESPWLAACQARRREWDDFKRQRYQKPCLHDAVWNRSVLTQPAAIKITTDWVRAHDAVGFFDAGDVQANGFQIVEDDRIGRTVTETGASYMGFAVSALLATALARQPFYGVAFTGDGSFTMNPQILIDGIQHGARGCILLLDNRRMGAIAALQDAQYGADHATSDRVDVDYRAWAASVEGVHALDGGESPDRLRAALDEALDRDGLSLVHVPVYYGPDPLGGLGAFGRWNVGNWVQDTQALRHEIGL